LSEVEVWGEVGVNPKPVTISDGDLSALRSLLNSANSHLYAVLDSADEPEVVERIQESEDRGTNLYVGSAQRDYWAISPYLLRMQPADLDWILGNLQEDAWGILAETNADLSTIKRHFRKFLTVKEGESGRFLLFRFYDPRVLPPFLESCTLQQARAFFGPIQSFYFFSDSKTVRQAKLSDQSGFVAEHTDFT
jgi:hypothetical protein